MQWAAVHDLGSDYWDLQAVVPRQNRPSKAVGLRQG